MLATTRTRWTRLRRTALSLGIVGCLGLQALAGSGWWLAAGPERRATAWPFLDYAMFREARHSGERATSWIVRARAAGGREFELSPLEPPLVEGLRVHALIDALLTDDEPALVAWCAAFARGTGERLVVLDWFEASYVLRRAGFAPPRLTLLRSVRLERSEHPRTR